MTDDTHDVQGEAELLNWACTNCGYRVEGELPEKCPDCGADKEMFDEVRARILQLEQEAEAERR